MQNESAEDLEDKKIAFWLLQNGFAESPKQALRFIQAALQNQCTQEMTDSFTMKILLDKEIPSEHLEDISVELPEVGECEIMQYLNRAIDTAKKRLEMWKELPRDTNARFFYSNLKKVDWNQDA